jgi:putative transcriptional regulator
VTGRRATLAVTATLPFGTLGNMPRALGRSRHGGEIRQVAEHPPLRLANRVRVARAERDISQTQLADAVGVSRQTISSIETGQYVPSALLAFRLAAALAVRVDHLFWLEGGSR